MFLINQRELNNKSFKIFLQIAVLAFLLSMPTLSIAQCWPPLIPSATCGVLGGDITPVSGSNSFCNGDSVAVLLTSGLAVDSICIDWGDNKLQILPGSAVGTVVYHYYNINPPDTCPDPPPLVTQITVTFVKSCPGSYSMSKSIEVITIQFLPNTDFFISPDSFLCVNENLCSVVDGLTAPYTCTNAVNVGGDTAFYSWDMGNGDVILDTAINVNTYNCPNYLYTDTGNYTITLTCENKCGLTSSIVPITVVTSEIDVGINLLDTCSPVIFTPSISTTNINTFFWTLNPALPGNIISAPTNDTTIISITNSGNFTLSLNTTGGCCAFPLPNICGWDTMITVYPGPELISIPIPDTCVLVPLNLDLNSYYSGFILNDSMQWTVYENGMQLLNTISFIPPIVTIDSGEYIVEVTYANNCGIAVFIDTFNVFNPFTVAVPPDDTICAGTGIYYLHATPEGGTWTWNGNHLPDSTFVISSTSDTIVEFVYSIGFGLCAAADSFTVYFPGSNVSGGPDRVLCENGGTITLPVGSHPNGVWSGSPAISGNIYDPAAAVINPDVIIYTVTLASGCSVNDSVIISTNALPLNAIALPDTSCVGLIINFNYVPINLGDTISWDFGDSNSAGGTAVMHSYNLPGKYYIKTLINNFGCKDSLRDSIIIMPNPNPTFSINGNGCTVFALNAQNLSPDTASSSFTWFVINLTSGDTVQNFAGTYLPTINIGQNILDSTDFAVVLLDESYCDSIITSDTLTVYPKPITILGSNCVNCCQYDSIQFFNTSSIGNPNSWIWFIDNVQISTSEQIPKQVFSLLGNHTVTLVTGNACGTDTATININITPSTVIAGFNLSPLNNFCAPLTIQVNSFSTFGSVNQFFFGDGNFDVGDTLTHTYDSTGTFTITLIADGLCGIDTFTQVITVDSLPDMSFVTNDPLCDEEQVHFTNTSSPLSAIKWYFGDGDSSIAANPSHLYNTPPFNFDVTLIGTSISTGCIDTLIRSIDLNDSPSAPFTVSSPSACNGVDTIFFSSSTSLNNISWDFGDGSGSASNPTYHVYPIPGTYFPQLTVIDTSLCKTDSLGSPITIHKQPTADFTYSQNVLCTSPALIQFDNLSDTAALITYDWNFTQLGTSSMDFEPLISVNTSTSFPVTLIAVTPFCRDSITKPVKVYAETIANIIHSGKEGCPPLTISLSDSSINASYIHWNFGFGSTSDQLNTSVTYNDPGGHTITLTATYDSVCFDVASISIEVYEKPSADILVQETYINSLLTHLFLNTSVCNGICTQLWHLPNGQTSTDFNTNQQFLTDGKKWVSLVVTNQNDCSDSTSVCVNVTVQGALVIPNALIPSMIPDERGYFIPKGYNLKEYEIEIFSTFGERIWVSTDLNANGSPTGKWDGTHYKTGEELPMGAYVWKVTKAVFFNGRDWQGMEYYSNDGPSTVGTVTIKR